MKSRWNWRFCFVFCCLAVGLCPWGFAEVRLPRLVSDGMVLQRDTEVTIWGWAEPGEVVTVAFEGQHHQDKANIAGQWRITLAALKAGGPYEMDIRGFKRITLKNILVGDVWICSGQSNMELPMIRVRDRYPDLIATANNPKIRQFKVPQRYDFNVAHEDVTDGYWEAVTPETIGGFSATGYFFAAYLYEQYGVPIGLINSALGGSPAEAWLSEDALQAFPEHLKVALQFKDDAYVESVKQDNEQRQNQWYARLDKLDKGLVDGKRPWLDLDFDDSDWSEMNVPGFWGGEGLEPVNGAVWFRKEFEVPAAMAGKAGLLRLGAIVDADHAYINGTFVGTTSYQYPPRRYEVPAGVLKAGKNVIGIRVINSTGRGGFMPDKPYEISAGGRTIDLKGLWKYKIGAVMEPLQGPVFIRWKPLGLYNGMIAPLVNYRIKGVIWYQGESNVGRAAEYQTLFPAVIANWRAKWGQGDFPFLFVQLANFLEAKNVPVESGWAELREAQLKSLSVPNTGMAVTIDIGEWNDVHPLNKGDVGKRLGLAARKFAYGEDLVYSGPIFESMRVEGNRAILSFTHVGGGLVAKGGDLRQFAIVGADKKFVWAKAVIKDNKVIVWNYDVKEPAAVRYAWADNPEGANLYNSEGLPASPFRTGDDF